MKTKTVVWVGENRMIPYHGIGETGKDKSLPESMADNFISQGLAKLKNTVKKLEVK